MTTTDAAGPNRGTPQLVGSAAGVQSVERVVNLLEAMGDVDGEITLSDLCVHTGLPMATIHRLLRTLCGRGYVRQLPSRRYTLGPRLIRLGESAGRRLGAGARPHLEEAAVKLGETVNLVLIDRDMVVYVAQASSAQSMRMLTEVGRRAYCHCSGVGKMVLSQLPDQTVREIVARVGLPALTGASITDVDTLLREIHEIRERGYAVDDGEQELGVRCFAVSVPGAPTPAAVSVSGPATRATPEFGAAAVPVLHDLAERVSAELISAG